MRSTHFCRAAFVASALHSVIAQGSVPTDLTAGFNSEVQVSFTGEANEGFKDGTTFSKDQVTEEPTFALGDSDGIAPQVLYTIIMVDTSDDNARTLHYARANFQHSEGVKIASEDQPLLEYKAPGTLGETGDERKYTFLMYTNPQRRKIDSLNLPGDGEVFDVKKFQDDNGLEDPSAGTGMVVSLNGEASPEPSSSSSSQRPAATQAPSSTAAPSSAPTRSAAPSTSESEPESTTVAAPSTSESESEAATSAASTTSESDSESAPAAPTPTEGSQDQTPSSAAGRTTNLAPASPTPSTLLQTSAVANATASSTTSSAPAEQTGSGGSMLPLPWIQCAVLAPVVVFAGLLV